MLASALSVRGRRRDGGVVPLPSKLRAKRGMPAGGGAARYWLDYLAWLLCPAATPPHDLLVGRGLVQAEDKGLPRFLPLGAD
jgi:hypothetical protein